VLAALLLKDANQNYPCIAEWDFNSSASIKVSPIDTNTKLTVSELVESDLVDEDDLLAASEVTVSKKVSGCGDDGPAEPGSRRACKNCSCGLAEEEAAAEAAGLSASSVEKKSSCGNCSKGDAFRCSSCPYRGLPVTSNFTAMPSKALDCSNLLTPFSL